MVHLTINGLKTEVENGSTILQAAEKLGIEIPTFCYDKRLVPQGACRICVVEVQGSDKLMAACTTPVQADMVVETHSEKVIKTRKEILELMIENHPLDCLTCEKSGECKLQDYCYEYDVKEGPFHSERKVLPLDDSNPFYISDQISALNAGNACKSVMSFNARERSGNMKEVLIRM